MTERVENLLQKIPGYTGYRRKESMRDDDKRLRDDIARTLDHAIANLTALGSQLAANRNLQLISIVEQTVSHTRQLQSRVSTASYGYGGLFSDRSVDDAALTQLKAFDVAFESRVEELATSITDATRSAPPDSSDLNAIQQQLADLNRLLDARGDVIETATPTQDQDVLALLEPSREPTEREAQLLRLRRGGTIAILGDNFQLSAHIALEDNGGNPVLTLVRLDQGPDWLAVQRADTGVRAWRVTESAPHATQMPATSATASVSGPQGTQTDVPATYDVTVGGAGDTTTVTIRLAPEGSTRAYAGDRVPLLDIQVFSEGTPE